MRWLINYIRQCICKHDFEEHTGWMWRPYRETGKAYREEKLTLVCRKCGYAKSYWIGTN